MQQRGDLLEEENVEADQLGITGEEAAWQEEVEEEEEEEGGRRTDMLQEVWVNHVPVSASSKFNAVRLVIMERKSMSLVFLLQVSLVSSYVLLCYYVQNSVQRLQSIKFYPENVDPCLCTHLIYADHDSKEDVSEWKDDDLYKRFNDLKKKNKNLKTLLGYGDWARGIKRFHTVAITQESRKKFIDSVVLFLRKHGFDGLDLDGRYPGYQGSTKEDKHHLTLLIKEMMKAFKAEAKSSRKARLLLTVPVASNKRVIDVGYEISELSKNVDFITVVTLHFNGPWNQFTAHNSPLYKGSVIQGQNIYFNVDYSLKYWRDKGAPAEKLLVTFPTYGNSYILKTSKTGVGAPVSKGGDPGPYSGRRGFMTYKEVCTFLKNATTQMIEDQKVPYAVNGNQWVGYDDLESFKAKAEWLKENKFGGATLSALDQDDYSGTHCNQGTYPLTKTLKTALGITTPALFNKREPF
ncbi:chitinase-3-like protein 1 [Mustelus asterias]